MKPKSKHKSLNFPFYVTKRLGFSKKKYWAIRVGGILLAFFLAGVVCTILKPGSFGTFFHELFRGCFDFSDISTVIDLLVTFSLLLLIAITLTPAFKMKFWNIGAEGQILVGCLAAAGIARFNPDLPNALVLILALLGAQAASTIWTIIPAIFKALFNTNETLFTLMMNYIATVLSAMMISLWVKNGSMAFGVLSNGIFPSILDNTGTLAVILAIVIFIGMYFYIKMGKHGYEVSIVGESRDTAAYVGISANKVMLRAMAVSGVLFGTIGWLIVCGVNQSFNATIVGGKGFTGVLIAWLGHFEPLEIALFSFLAAVMDQGTRTAASAVNISSAQFSAICTGVFFFVVIACEFFSRYQIKMHHKEKTEVESL